MSLQHGKGEETVSALESMQAELSLSQDVCLKLRVHSSENGFTAKHTLPNSVTSSFYNGVGSQPPSAGRGLPRDYSSGYPLFQS